MKDFTELDLNVLNQVAGGGGNVPGRVDLLDPADPNQAEWCEIIRSVARARKIYEGTSLEQTVLAIETSYLSYGCELIHVGEYLAPIWDTLGPYT